MEKKLNNKGFTLIEVLIAVTIFAIFVSVFVMTQGNNVTDSLMMREELTLRRLCEDKLHDILQKPPEFQESLTMTKENKSFEKFPDYEYTVIYKQIELPDLQKLKGKEEGENTDSQNEAIEKEIYEKAKKILKNALWQVEVTVNKKGEKGFPYKLSTWLINENAQYSIQ